MILGPVNLASSTNPAIKEKLRQEIVEHQVRHALPCSYHMSLLGVGFLKHFQNTKPNKLLYYSYWWKLRICGHFIFYLNIFHFSDFTDTAEYWSFPFESPALSVDLDEAWEEIKPLYELLLTYVRRRLREYYGPERINRQAPLPSHILGNMWAQSWTNIFDITQPYPGQTFLDVTPEMTKQVGSYWE